MQTPSQTLQFMFASCIRMWEKQCDLSGFDRSLIVDARQAGLSISETAELRGFSHTQHFVVVWKTKTHPMNGSSADGKHLLIEEGGRGQMRMVRVVGDDGKAMVSHIITLGNCGAQKSISESTTCQETEAAEGTGSGKKKEKRKRKLGLTHSGCFFWGRWSGQNLATIA